MAYSFGITLKLAESPIIKTLSWSFSSINGLTKKFFALRLALTIDDALVNEDDGLYINFSFALYAPGALILFKDFNLFYTPGVTV